MTASLSLDRPTAAGLDRPTAPVRLPAAPRRRIGPAALVSVGLHAALIGLAVLWARYHPPVVLVPLERPATVQLVMSPPGGEPAPVAEPQPKPTPDSPKAAAAAPKAATAAPKAPPAAPATAKTAPQPKSAPDASKAAAATPNAPPAAPATADAAPPPPKPVPDAPEAAAAAPKAAAAAPVTAEAAPSPPAPASPQDDLRLNSAEVESDTNALVTGDLVVPPSPDVKYHNRKPSYPAVAGLEGEQGTVILLIHVSPDGLVSGVDVVRSSGFSALDRAARDAVLTWHFLPSVRDGQPVPSDMPIRFVFALD